MQHEKTKLNECLATTKESYVRGMNNNVDEGWVQYQARCTKFNLTIFSVQPSYSIHISDNCSVANFTVLR
jgi:hypothetical protein